MKSILVVMLAIVGVSAAFANPQSGKQRLSREQLATVQARHIAEQLALTDEVTQKFVEVYCQQQKEIWELGPRQSRKSKAAETDEQQIQARFERSEKILEIRKKYYKQFSAFLTQAQINRMYGLEKKMMKRMAQKGKRKSGKKGD